MPARPSCAAAGSNRPSRSSRRSRPPPKSPPCSSAPPRSATTARRSPAKSPKTPPPATTSSPALCVDWEEASAGAGVRTVNPRIGIVLSAGGGALLKMMQPAGPLNLFKLGLRRPNRPRLRLLELDPPRRRRRHHRARARNNLRRGPRSTPPRPSPRPTPNWPRRSAAPSGRPALLPVPPQLLKLLFGEGASVLLASQRVLPTRTLDSGYRFAHPEIGEAVQDLVG